MNQPTDHNSAMLATRRINGMTSRGTLKFIRTIAVLLMTCSATSFAQEGTDSFADTTAVRNVRYSEKVELGKAYYNERRFGDSVDAFAQAFAEVRGPADGHLYEAACAAALDGQVLRAYTFLQRAVERGWDRSSLMETDPDLDTLRSYPALWAELLANTRASLARRLGSSYDTELAARLETLYHADQGIRTELNRLEQQHGVPLPDSVGVPFNARWQAADADNLARLESLVAQYGWPVISRVGEDGATTAFLIVQHAPLDVQLHYLPVIEDAVARSEAEPQHLALLTDRVRVGQGLPQLYGSQVRVDPVTGTPSFFPIEDEPNVNARRAGVGLGPLEEYAVGIGFVYNPK